MKMLISLIVLMLVSSTELQALDCEACRHTVGTARSIAEEPLTKEVITGIALGVCLAFVKEEFGVCKGAVFEMADVILDSFAKHYLDSDFVCYSIGMCSSPKFVPQNFTAWEDALLSTNQTSPRVLPTSTSSFTFGHLTDVHFDFFYSEGSDANCGQPVCCRDWLGPGSAGPFGDYNCDIPIRTFESTLQQLAALDPEFVLWTGDTPPHDVWNQSRSYQLEFQKVSSELLKKYFPSTPVYGIFGNHGSYPVNVYNPEGAGWLLYPFADYFGYWLPESAKETMQTMGTYSILHKDTLRIIAINTQACNNMNWYLIANVTDPNGQIEWLIDELKGAEERKEKVYIFGHIPVNDGDCLNGWAEHFDAVVSRFSNIILGQFYGHTHTDYYAVNRHVKTQEPVSVQWVAPSTTTYTDKNPSFRLYESDTDSKVVIDIHQYRLDLPNANKIGQAVYEKAYSMKEEYGINDLSPETMDALASQFRNDTDSALKWLFNHQTGGPQVSKTCDEGCRHGIYCQSRWGTQKLIDVCNGSKPSLTDKGIALLYGPWTYKYD